MIDLLPHADPGRPLRLLCIGAHSDDIEIGCGGSLLTWLASGRALEVTWMVLTAGGTREREREARRSATALLRRTAGSDIALASFRDGFLPSQYEDVKAFFESVRRRCDPDIVLTHRLEDRHQDHRLASELTWNTWRNHLVLEYEIMKYEGDLGHPNVFVPLAHAVAERKKAHLMRHFGTQHAKGWFVPENFDALARLRGLECRAPSGLAEAFHARKLRLTLQAV
ncbi:MAG: PIG-L family deacetylase [Piscinibacter sp.]|uniref:PIG-L deacetylase family protein n=1 Tax=Piscinibacter sp. TaxID=1903157 RepID=UPI0025904992|nr:PIG-L deacetylase family protein [Piscinibacter sp.]MCW5662485.1 PIG-L family deacetylase [Piscinibacter sp.]